jgi:hypothetical protein
MSSSSHSPLIYVDCDIPDGMTLVEWRTAKVRAARRSREEAREARSQARRAALKRRLPRIALRPQPSFRPRFA